MFGTSGGAQIGLNLAARYPKLVRAVVAHEPPSMMLLPDPSEAVADAQSLYDTYRREGVDAAMQKFFFDNGLADEPGQEGAPPEFACQRPKQPRRLPGSAEISSTGLPTASCRSRSTVPTSTRCAQANRVSWWASAKSLVGQPIDSMGRALAEKLGTEPVLFPGDHMGFDLHADIFAENLHRAFAQGKGI